MSAPVVDAHQHFWDPARAGYPWMTDELAAIRRRLMPEDLEPLLDEAGVQATVVVQARSSQAETRELLGLAAEHDFVAGVVGWVDLALPGVGETIAELRSAPGGRFLAGLRHQVHDEADARWLLRPDVRRGLAAAAEAGLAYDLLVRERELPAALELARSAERPRLVIDHAAKPPLRGGALDGWARALAPFAEVEHVSCKLSGLVTEADWDGWRQEDLRPAARLVLEWFGEDRVLFGSDWPVCTLAATYRQVLDVTRELVAPLDKVGSDKVFGLNAVRFYGLRLPAPAGGRARGAPRAAGGA